MQRWVVACSLALLLSAVFADECPDGGHCKDGDTCCQHPSDGYQCCPFDQAECCADHVHCCPAGMMCDVGRSRCENATLTVPWATRTTTERPRLCRSFRMIKSYVGEDDDNICPDESRCPAEFSCLRALTKYGCCPLPQGIPCSDGKHCCPQGHSCSADGRSCIKKDVTSTVLCSDGVSECPEETSCCEGPDGQIGCCPMPRAVCCDDKVHCCPEGSQCDLETSKCISTSSKRLLPMWAKFPARRRAEWEDQKEEQRVTSEAATGSESEEGQAEALVTITERVSDVQCDDTISCPDETTCCKTDEGWACCPAPEAVCCDDHVHCCPHGTICDVAQGTCDDPSGARTTPMMKKTSAFITTTPSTTSVTQDFTTTASSTTAETQDTRLCHKRVLDVQCDDTSACPDGTTCCKTDEGGWGCCPLPNAVCCEDHSHCCPEGTKCDLAAGTCDDPSDGRTTPMMKKISAFITTTPSTTAKTQDFTTTASSTTAETQDTGSDQKRFSDVKCDDTAACPDGTTCCKTTEGEWGCCPLPNAVCCADHIYCCPEGTTCGTEAGTCDSPSDGQTTPMMKKIPAFITTTPSTTAETQDTGSGQSEEETDSEEDERDDEDEDDEDLEHRVHCKHHQNATCHRNSTCCHSGHHRRCCCPMPNATCCSDGKHCCPYGYQCQENHRGCTRDGVEVPWYANVPALPQPQEPEMSQENTPAPTTPGQSEDDDDDEYDDDDDDDDDYDDIDEFSYDYDEEDKVHCDSITTCPKGSSCCKSGKSWGCCPLPQAVCCSDRKHCCPPHHTCSKALRACVRDDAVVIPWYAKLPALSNMETVSNDHVRCADGHRCPQYNTCCLLSSGEYGCCPMENAQCCSDKKHCCPKGFNCDPSSSSCQKPVLLEVEFVPLTPADSVRGKRCGRYTCEDTEKCCMNRGMPHCCPYVDGVCCDVRTCCQAGQQCTPKGDCIPAGESTWENWLFVLTREEENPKRL